MKKGFDGFLAAAFKRRPPELKDIDMKALKAGIIRRIENRLLRFRILFIRVAVAAAAAVVLLIGSFMLQRTAAGGHPEKVFYASHIEVFEKMDLYENFDVITDFDAPSDKDETRT